MRQLSYNGLDASVKLLAVIAAESCTDQSQLDALNRMLDQYSQNDNAVETVYQQQANCAQRIFEFLQVIAVLNDRENAYAEQIDALEDGLIEADHAADNATAQVAASLYFSTRMAGIIAFEFDA